jgi:GNAT superfamily N-acetyltransferase
MALHEPRYNRLAGTPPRTQELFELERTGYGCPEGGMFMAFEEGTGVGVVTFYVAMTPAYPTMVPRKILYVPILSVSHEHHRKGIGKALLERVKAWGKEHHCQDIRLAVQLFNQEAAKFYEAAGFSTYERILNLPLE